MSDINIVAYAHSYDGYGWLYLDNGHGSDWEARAKAFADATPLVMYQDYAELAVEYVRLVQQIAATDGISSAVLEVAKSVEDREADLREQVANLQTELAAAGRTLEKLTRQRNSLLARVNAAERLAALAVHAPKEGADNGTEKVS